MEFPDPPQGGGSGRGPTTPGGKPGSHILGGSVSGCPAGAWGPAPRRGSGGKSGCGWAAPPRPSAPAGPAAACTTPPPSRCPSAPRHRFATTSCKFFWEKMFKNGKKKMEFWALWVFWGVFQMVIFLNKTAFCEPFFWAMVRFWPSSDCKTRSTATHSRPRWAGVNTTPTSHGGASNHPASLSHHHMTLKTMEQFQPSTAWVR